MQEIHQICQWNELDTNLYLVLITIKGILTSLLAKITRDKLTFKVKFVSGSFQYQVWRFSYLGLHLH